MSETIVVSDSSCLVVLERINELSLLQKLFNEVRITGEVAAEFGDAGMD
jgi:predicted nucleic acid-binding protein